MAKPGAGKMAEKDKGGAEEAPAESALVSGERKAALFSAKAAATTVGGGLLTLGFTVAQIAYTDHLTVLQRQNDYGIAFQRDFFALSGQIENQLIDIFDMARNGSPDQAVALQQSTLHPMGEQWRQVRLWFRVRGAQIYGRHAGDLVYDPREEAVSLDDCAVERAPGQAAGQGPCLARQQREARRLAEIIARIRTNRISGGDAALRPASFQSNFRLTRAALNAYLGCLRTAAARQIPGRPCDALSQIVGTRVQFMVFTREDLSSEIMQSSSLRD
jgi:hypothetical protein